MTTSHVSENLDSVNVFFFPFKFCFSPFCSSSWASFFSSNDRLNVYIINYGLKGASVRSGLPPTL